jgi:hypothetical protein
MNKFNESVFLAYCAGFIDGEGSFTLHILRPTINNRRKYTFYCHKFTLVNTHIKVLEKIQDFFGGTISKRKKVANRRECYQLVIHGDNLVNLCEKILPYSFVKTEQIKVILEYAKTIDGRRNSVTAEQRSQREFLHNKLHELNQGIFKD